MSAVAMVRSLWQLLAWPTEHLTEAADYWEAIGGRCYGVANQVWRDAESIDWQGEAADALRRATHSDMIATSAVADQLHEVAQVARSGASDLYAARSRVRYAVEDARTAGFDVGEDLSVTDRLTGGSAAQRAARQAQAQTFASDIRQRATQLVGLDQQVAGKITAAVVGIRHTFPQNPTFSTPPMDNRAHAVDNHSFKQEPLPPPGPPGNPFAGWTEEQKKQVATEIAHGHALEKHPEDFPREWTDKDLARWIYESMNDPNTRFGTNIDSGALTLLRDGRIVYINPKGRDYGSAFTPEPRPGSTWRTPQEYFEQYTRAAQALPPPTPGRLQPLTPDEMAPPAHASPPATAPQPPPGPRPAPPPPPRVEVAPAPKPAPPLEGGEGPMLPGGPGLPMGPQIISPPHSHPHWIGETPEDLWDNDHH